MRKIWKNVYNWGDTEKKIDSTIEHHINHFKHLLGIDSEVRDLPYNANAQQEVKLAKKSRLTRQVLRDLMRFVGSDNVQVDDFSRARHSFGKYYGDILRMRMGKVVNVPDAVVSPRTEEDIIKVIGYCNLRRIAVVPWGGALLSRAPSKQKKAASRLI